MRTLVMLGSPTGGSCHSAYVRSLYRMLALEFTDPHVDYGLLHDGYFPAGCYVARNRNAIVRRFLNTEASWLLQLDSDMEWKPDLLRKLMAEADEDERQIIFGSYLNLHWPTAKECRMAGGTPGQCDIVSMFHTKSTGGAYATMPILKEKSIVEVDAGGTGCLLVHRSVFKVLIGRQAHEWGWFPHDILPDGRVLGEDLAFARNAQAAGFKLWGTTNVHLRHWKQLPIHNPDWWEDESADNEAVGGS